MKRFKQFLISFIACGVFLASTTASKADEKVTTLLDFASYKDVKAKKKAFFGFMRPIVEYENAKVAATRQRFLELAESTHDGQRISDADAMWVKALAQKFKVNMGKINDKKAWQALVTKVDIVPTKLALSQAANESAWGTSRFAKQGLNMFGMWCFRKGCGIVPSSRSAGMTHEVAVFPSINDSVAAYIQNINSLKTYAALRKVRARMRSQGQEPTAYVLAEGLRRYSERGEAYVRELQSMIRINSKLMESK